jgi:hypothetical protein
VRSAVQCVVPMIFFKKNNIKKNAARESKHNPQHKGREKTSKQASKHSLGGSLTSSSCMILMRFMTRSASGFFPSTLLQ